MKAKLDQLRANPLFKKYEMYIPPIMATILVILLLTLVIIPNVLQFFETQKKITETEEKVSFFQNKAKILQAIKKDEYTKGVNNSLALLPADKEAPAAIAQIYYLVNIANVNVQNMSFGDNGGGVEGKVFRISLELNGTIASLTSFITKLKETPRIMRVNSLEVGTQGSTTDVFAIVTLNAYYEPLPEKTTGLEDPINLPTDKDLEVLKRLNTTSFPVITEDSNYNGVKGKPNPFQ